MTVLKATSSSTLRPSGGPTGCRVRRDTPRQLGTEWLNKESIRETPVYELYKAGVVFEKNLVTLVREAAVGMGYGRRRLFLEIELPLAMPVIIAGLRIAAVTTVGLVTITALIGQGGVGFFILSGLNRFFNTEIILGTALSVIIAVALDTGLVILQWVLTPWARRKSAVV